MDDLEKAIAIVSRSRQTHVEWIEWYKYHPEDEEKYARTVGESKHHEDRVDDYDHVLRVLAALKNTAGWTGAVPASVS